jgi:mono/diheme cytochrome c family protein
LALSGGMAALSLALIVAAGCNKGGEGGAPPPGGASGGAMASGGPGGPGRMMGGPGGPGGRMGGGPVAATATGAEIYQAKCRCHGPDGKGGRAPVLTGGAGKSDDELFKIIHDGKGKMPAFASQLSDDQIKKVAAEVKGFK